MGTILDALARKDRVEATSSDLYRLMWESTEAGTVMNTVSCNTPHKYIREMTIGKPENMDLKANIKCKDSGDVDKIADVIHKRSEEHISGTGRDGHVDGGVEKTAPRDIKLVY